METIEDIVREMRGCHDAGKWLEQPDSWSDKNCVEALKHYADRVEASAKERIEGEMVLHITITDLRLENHRLINSVSDLRLENSSLRAECESWRKQALEENSALDVARDENASLRSALKPVLECDLSKFGDGFCYVDLFEAVLEAKRIYNESEVK